MLDITSHYPLWERVLISIVYYWKTVLRGGPPACHFRRLGGACLVSWMSRSGCLKSLPRYMQLVRTALPLGQPAGRVSIAAFSCATSRDRMSHAVMLPSRHQESHISRHQIHIPVPTI